MTGFWLDETAVAFAAPNVVHLRTPALAREVNKDQRRRDAAALLRELAASYGPRRAHKLRAMADFITAPNPCVTQDRGASRREA